MSEADTCTCSWCTRIDPPTTLKGNTMKPLHKMVEDVRDFHRATDTPIGSSPCLPSDERIQLRERLIHEELRELYVEMARGDLAKIAEESIDVIYVIIGMLEEYGVPTGDVWDAKHAANMMKVDPVTGKVRRREDGKIMKPEGWQKPDIAGVMVGGE